MSDDDLIRRRMALQSLGYPADDLADDEIEGLVFLLHSPTLAAQLGEVEYRSLRGEPVRCIAADPDPAFSYVNRVQVPDAAVIDAGPAGGFVRRVTSAYPRLSFMWPVSGRNGPSVVRLPMWGRVRVDP